MVAVSVKGVSKRFRIYHDRATSLKERLIFWNREKHEDFWALRDVDLEINQGVSLGLIGRNGSGKSTLLKVISRILYPDRGSVQVRGRLSSLLELGAGFHPDFNGRENIFLNASIMGLTRKEILARMDEIVQFSELQNFIDTPVRNYSSGMYARLGFSVAVHVDPDVLLVDEVLSVGDLAFQEKCMRRIRQLQEKGTTIVMVSHSPEQIRQVCDEAIWLDQGVTKAIGKADEISDAYEEFMKSH